MGRNAVQPQALRSMFPFLQGGMPDEPGKAACAAGLLEKVRSAEQEGLNRLEALSGTLT